MGTGVNNIRLGAFIFTGFALLVAALFYISNSSLLFGGEAELKVCFTNTGGLQEGNNVLFSGINAGTVKTIELKDAKTIEVTLLIDKKILEHIPKNSMASIGTEGLMGNKVVNITPGDALQMAQHGDYLVKEKKADIDEMLETLSKSNTNIAEISEALKNTANRINNSALLNALDNKAIADDLESSMYNLRMATLNAAKVTATVNEIVVNTRQGKGAAGLLLSNQEFEDDLSASMANIRDASDDIRITARQLEHLSKTLDSAVVNGKGPLNTLLKDSLLSQKINISLENIKKGTENFNQNMEALKHNFLVRGYFKKQERQKAKTNDR